MDSRETSLIRKQGVGAGSAVCRGGACYVRWIGRDGGVVRNRLQGSEGDRLHQESEHHTKDHRAFGRVREVHI